MPPKTGHKNTRKKTNPQLAGDPLLNKIPAYRELTPASKRHVEEDLTQVLINWHKNSTATVGTQIKRDRYTKLNEPKIISRTAFLGKLLPFLPADSALLLKRTGQKGFIKDKTLHKNVRLALYEAHSGTRSSNLPVKKKIEYLNADERPSAASRAVFFPASQADKVFKKELLEKFKKKKREIRDERLREWGVGRKDATFKWIKKWELKKLRKLKTQKPRVF